MRIILPVRVLAAVTAAALGTTTYSAVTEAASTHDDDAATSSSTTCAAAGTCRSDAAPAASSASHPRQVPIDVNGASSRSSSVMYAGSGRDDRADKAYMKDLSSESDDDDDDKASFSHDSEDDDEKEDADERIIITDRELYQAVQDWAIKNGAYLNPKIEIRNDSYGQLAGMFATEPLAQDEVITDVPWQLIIKPPSKYARRSSSSHLHEQQDDDEIRVGGFCGLVKHVYHSIRKPIEEQTPYERFLSTRSRQQLPAFWSEPGKRMLQHLIGDTLPTLNSDRMIQDWWYEEGCNPTNNEEYDIEINDDLQTAFMIVLSYSEGPEGEHIVPLQDVLGHHNGMAEHNVDVRYEEGIRYQLVARHPIQVGEPLRISYNQCTWCAHFRNPSSENGYIVTPQLFELYGFIEHDPQRWVFPQIRLLFDIMVGSGGKRRAVFPKSVPPSQYGLGYLQYEIERLEYFEQHYCRMIQYQTHEDSDESKNNGTTTISTSTCHDVPTIELKAIWEYHQAVLDALNLALEAILYDTDVLMVEDVWDDERNEYNWYMEPEVDE